MRICVFCCLAFFSLSFCVLSEAHAFKSSMKNVSKAKSYQEYVNFFEKVFKTFESNYYLAPDRTVYKNFLEKFRTKIYPELKGEGKSDDYVRWRSSWFLTEALKSKEDKFSQFYPPAPAEKFQHDALGQRIDLGIEVKKVDAGFLVTRIEPRSDAYDNGLRENDVLLRLDGKDIRFLPQDEVEKRLSPLAGASVATTYFAHETKKERTIAPVSKEYFKQTVFLRPVDVPGIVCLEIPHFNRTTGDDLFKFLHLIRPYNPRGLVIDLRGNPGGPPLAAREVVSFFLKGGEEFAYFQKRGAPKDSLDVPTIADEYKFNGPIAILVDQDSGSSSELFSGVMQFRHRAIVFGVNTAGQVFLKSMFPFDDGSMVALITAPGYFPDGSRFSFNGITPDQVVANAPKDGLINLAAAYLAFQANKQGQ